MYKILIVDDCKTHRDCEKMIIGSALDKIGESHEIREAEDGDEALRKMALWVPDGIFLDIDMPFLDGIETLKQIMSNNDYGCPYVGMVTSHAETDKINQAFDLGASDYVLKCSYANNRRLEERLEETTIKMIENINIYRR